LRMELDIAPTNIRPGDKIILSGSIGNHGMSVMAQRSGISFEPRLLSDVRPLNGLVEAMLRKTKKIHVMRDPTRGGLATTLKELAGASGLGMLVNEDSIKVIRALQVPASCLVLILFTWLMKEYWWPL